MTTAEALDRGRESFGRRGWRDAYAQLSAADRETPLDPEDLERLATAAYLVGRDGDCADIWTRAHHEFLRRGDAARAARCAFWLTVGLLLRGELARADGWLARTRRLLDDGALDCSEQGYLLVLVAIQACSMTSSSPPRTCGWGTKASAAPASVRGCGSWAWRPAAVPSASPRCASARRCSRPTCLRPCSRGSRRARKEGLDLETRVMDGYVLELEDDTFDVAGSQFGVMLFPDMPRGVRELARVTKPGGRVLMNVYGAPQSIEFFAFFVGAIRAAVPAFSGPPMDPPPLPFQLQDLDRLRQELANAGLKDIRLETIIEKLEFQSGKHLWDWLTNSNPIASMILAELKLTDEQRAVVQQALEGMVRERAQGSGPAVLTNPVHIGVGTK
jgi:SAM-dependent methyltransferase